MSRFLRLPTKDPRTIARDIPGLSHILFPQLTSGLVASLNQRIMGFSSINAINESLIQKSTLSPSLLFEFSYVIAEEMIKEQSINYNKCFNKAVERQNKYYDFSLKEEENLDLEVGIATAVADNLVEILQEIKAANNDDIIVSPFIPGYEWVSNSTGDFSIGDSLIEVKCSNKNFSALDYRQILVYFLLGYIKSLNSTESTIYENLILVNPRLNKMIKCNGENLLFEVSAGRSKIETVQLFSAIIKQRYNDIDF